MNYLKIYEAFIADRRAKETELVGYTERHHILPRSLGGTDDPSNLIRLTAEDHIHAHILIAKVYGGALWASVFFMTKTSVGRGKTKRIPSKKELRLAAMAKRMHALNYRGEAHAGFGKKMSSEARLKMSKAQKARGAKGLMWTQKPENVAIFGGENHWTRKDPARASAVAKKGILAAAIANRGAGNPMHKESAKAKQRESHADQKASGTGRYSADSMKAKADSHRTPEYRAEAAVRVSGEKNPMYGMSGGKNPNARMFRCVETGEIFDSAKKAADWCGVEINRACSKGIKAGGYHWERVGAASPLAKAA